MTITMSETPDGHIRAAVDNDDVVFDITPGDALVAMEAFARVLGFTLVDRVERASLQELVTEIEADSYRINSNAAWQYRAEALAAAVSSALRFETKEV